MDKEKASTVKQGAILFHEPTHTKWYVEDTAGYYRGECLLVLINTLNKTIIRVASDLQYFTVCKR